MLHVLTDELLSLRCWHFAAKATSLAEHLVQCWVAPWSYQQP